MYAEVDGDFSHPSSTPTAAKREKKHFVFFSSVNRWFYHLPPRWNINIQYTVCLLREVEYPGPEPAVSLCRSVTQPIQQLIREMGCAGWMPLLPLHQRTLPLRDPGLWVGGVFLFYSQKVPCVFLLINTDGRDCEKRRVPCLWGEIRTAVKWSSSQDGDVRLRLFMIRTDSETGGTRCSD